MKYEFIRKKIHLNSILWSSGRLSVTGKNGYPTASLHLLNIIKKDEIV